MKNSSLCFVLVLILFAPIVLHAQAPIPNGNFESWSGDYPDGWFVNNSGSSNPITMTSDAHSGTAALHGAVIKLTNSGTESPIAISGGSPIDWGFPYTDHPTYFIGYYKYIGKPGDELSISAGFRLNGSQIGGAEFANTVTVNNYTEFILPINWSSKQAPDSAYINITILGADGSTSTAHLGSEMFIDDLAFTNATQSVTGESVRSFALEQSLPNPATEHATINYALSESSFATLTIYNAIGEVVATPVQELKFAGRYSITINTSSLPTATYWYRLCSGNKTTVRAMQILH
jgi:hypothetical protein